MTLFEINSTARSGHHAMLNWLIKNISGYEYQSYDKLKIIPHGVFYINEANFSKELSLDYISKYNEEIRCLFMSYENSEPNYSILCDNEKYIGPMSINNPNIKNLDKNYRIIFIRDFYSNLTSRIKHNNDRIKNGEKPLWDVGERFINLWKDSAKYILDEKCLYLKFEDWLTSKKLRNDFLSKITQNGELYDNNVRGSFSSFDERTNVIDRFDKEIIPTGIKNLIKNDNELHYLMGVLGYHYRSI